MRSALLLVALAASVACAQAQGDPFTQFNEPAPMPTVAAGAPSFDTHGIPAAAYSATTVPVLGTLAMPSASPNYLTAYSPTSVGAVSVETRGTIADRAYQPLPASVTAFTPAAVPPPAAYPAASAFPAAPGAGMGYAAPGAAAFPASAFPGPILPAPTPAPVPVATPAPAAAAPVITIPKLKPSIPIQDGMIARDDMPGEQIPVNASALPVLRVPEGTTAKLTYVCDSNGMLYIAVDREALIKCGTDYVINLAKMSGIKGAKSLTCPNNRLACPPNGAVAITVQLDNTKEAFAKVAVQWRNVIATALKTKLASVTLTSVEPAAAAAAAFPAPDAAAAAIPSSPSFLAAGFGPLRRLLQDTAAVVAPVKGAKGSDAAVEDTEARVEIEYKPRPKIVVTVQVQPLTKAEAKAVTDSTKSDAFSSKLFEGAKKLGLVIVDGFEVKDATSAPEFDFNAKAANSAQKAGDIDATGLGAVPLTAAEKAAKAARDAATPGAAAGKATPAGVSASVSGLPSLQPSPRFRSSGDAARAASATGVAVAALCVLGTVLAW